MSEHVQCEDCGKCRATAGEEFCQECKYVSCERGSDCVDARTAKVIPEAAVEAAAIAFASDADPWGVWAEQSESYRKFYRNRARPILEAAAPHIAARALREASAAYPLETAYGGAEHAVNWLKARADQIGAAE